MTRSALRRTFALRAFAALFACLGVSSAARAEDECVRTLAPNEAPNGARIVWPSPLNRTISLRLGALPLRSALDRVAQVAKVRLSYSRELIPLERSVCLAYDGVPVGDVLTRLLEGTGIEAIAMGNEQVVLAPQRGAPPTRATEVSHDLAVTTPAVLSPVVVRDGGTSSRSLPAGTASVSLGADKLLSGNISTMSQLMNGSIPGMWMWESSASGTMAQYGSLRGASSFGVGTPKVYIDGIEMANPLMLNQLDPASIEKLEVIRGPQGSALFGTDAIDGVIRITTRQDGANGSAGRVSLRSETGMSQSGFAPGGVLSQDHSLNVRAGNAFRSASLGLGMSTLGDYVPGSASRRLALNSSARILGSHGSLSGSARLSSERVGNVTSPLLAGLESTIPPLLSHRAGFRTPGESLSQGTGEDGQLYSSTTSFAPQSMNEYTLGVNGTLTTGERWTHSLVLGVDGYRLRNVAYDLSPMPTPADSALQAARGESNRLTMRATSSATFGGDNASARATFVGDVSMLHRDVELRNGWGSNASLTDVALPWRRNSGLTTQLDATLWRSLSLTGGVRLEHDDDQITPPRTSLLPMIGATMAKSAGDFTLKVRGAWGKAIRQPQLSLMGGGGSRGIQLLQSATNLKPEQQVGFEGGADFEFGNAFQFHVTRFDQYASNLIQAVAMAPSTGAPRVTNGSFTEPNYTLQNVGEIANHGWELQASTAYRTLRLDGSLSLVDSRVTAVSTGYRGDLRAGDRMLQVPARVGSLTTTWNPRGWSLSLGASRAWNWVNYDRLSLAQASASGWSAQNGHRPEGSELRAYWMTYDGATRLRAAVTRDLFRNLSLRLSGENLLGIQRGEPDNVTIVPGRTIRAGFTTRF